jgi:hypothetical protein
MAADGTETDADGDLAISAEESLALIERQRLDARQKYSVIAMLFYGPWGAAYLLGFGSQYLTYPTAVGPHVPQILSSTIISVTFPVAAIIAIWTGVRTGRGVRGPTRAVGAMYGWSWTLGFATLTAINIGVADQGLSPDAVTLLWSGSSLLLVGVLYLAGGALREDRFQYGLGLWTLISAAASVFAGVPGNFLVVALGGGGGLLLGTVYFALRWWRHRTRR